MRIVTPIALAVMALAAIGPDQAPVSRTGRTVAVHGTATVKARPDRVSFTAGVETRDASATAAYRANTARIRAILAALKARGVAESQMQTSHLDISTVPGKGLTPRTFNVSNLVTTIREDPGEVGDLIQAAVAAGANDVGNLNFFVADPLGLEQQGLRLAFQNARAKAEIMAKEAGAALGDVVSMADETVYGSDELHGRLRSLGYVGNHSIAPGSERLNCSVTVVFALK